MTVETTRLDLRLRRRGMIGYAVGMAIYVVAVVALYPSFEHDTSLNSFTSGNSTVAALFGASGSLTSPTGWMSANVYANFLPLVVLLLCIGYGASCVAGQEEDGTLGLVPTLPRAAGGCWRRRRSRWWPSPCRCRRSRWRSRWPGVART